MNSRQAWAIRVGLFLLCAWVSAEHMDDRWVIGPMFGLVVLAWHLPLPPAFTPQHGFFVLASTLIYVLVAHMAIEGPTFSDSDGMVYQAVAVGTVLLPVAHRQFLGGSWDRVIRTMIGVYAIWVIITKLFEMADRSLGGLLNSAAIWQALYLYFMFVPRARRAA